MLTNLLPRNEGGVRTSRFSSGLLTSSCCLLVSLYIPHVSPLRYCCHGSRKQALFAGAIWLVNLSNRLSAVTPFLFVGNVCPLGFFHRGHRAHVLRRRHGQPR